METAALFANAKALGKMQQFLIVWSMAERQFLIVWSLELEFLDRGSMSCSSTTSATCVESVKSSHKLLQMIKIAV